MSTPDRQSPSPDPAARPRPFARRLQLLMILLVLPVAAVILPGWVVTGIFGQRPASKAPPRVTPVRSPDTSGLTAALAHSAESLLPAPAPLTPETIRLTVRADHVAARAEKVANQAKALGGSALAGVSSAGEKHLFVDLPGGRADAFHQAVTRNVAPVLPNTAPAPGAAHDRLEVVIRGAADDE